MDKAKTELSQIQELSKDESLKEVTVWDINSVYELVQIAEKVLSAEIMAKEGNFESSIKLLNEAIVIEDALNYNEPPDWFFSVRHHLGAIQLSAGKFNEAIVTYNEDLDRLPNNGWAHYGLKQAYQNLNDAKNVSKIDELIKNSWAFADIEL